MIGARMFEVDAQALVPYAKIRAAVTWQWLLGQKKLKLNELLCWLLSTLQIKSRFQQRNTGLHL